MNNLIKGAGGKGGGGGVEADDTLFSASIARVVELVSEGEIEGLLDGERSIYFNNTPLVSGNDSNFEAVGWTYRNGTQVQEPINGFPGAEHTMSVNQEAKSISGIKNGKRYGTKSDVLRTINLSTGMIDALRVTVYTPALVNADKKGNINGSSVAFRIYLSRNGGEWISFKTYTMRGKSSTKFEKTFRLDIPDDWKTNLTTLGLRLERISASSTSVKIQNKIFLGTYTTVSDNKLAYPNSALIATQVDARHFASIPSRSYEIKGVKIKVPSNYTPYDPGHCVPLTHNGEVIGLDAGFGEFRRQDICEVNGGVWTGTKPEDGIKLYDGYWDGTFDTKWTSNPAWVLYDMCTDTRYGLGNWLQDNQLDKWALYEVARYCDAVDEEGYFVGVDDGWGHKEPRYTCNLYLQNKREAYSVLNEIASIFRGIIYWQEGQIVPVMDAPKDPVMLFSSANVIDGAFNYEGSSIKVRHNVAKVSWNNPSDLYKKNVEYVEDVQGISSTNRIFSIDINAVGCTSQGQAKRIGKWILYSERNETEVVTFSTGYEGIGIRPGDNIKIADAVRAGVRYGGRVVIGSSNEDIELDSTVPVSANKTYTMTIIHTEQACINTTDNLKVDSIPMCIDDSGRNVTTDIDIDSDSEKCIDAGFIWQEDPKELCIAAGLEWKPRMWAETQSVSGFDSDQDVTSIKVSTPFDTAPNAETMWILEELGEEGVEAQDFKVLSVRESDKNILEISALKHTPSKYDHIEKDAALDIKSISKLPKPSDPVPQPTGLAIRDELYFDSKGSLKNKATFSWDEPRVCDSYCDIEGEANYSISESDCTGTWVTAATNCLGGTCYVNNEVDISLSREECLGYEEVLTAGSCKISGAEVPVENCVDYCDIGGEADYSISESDCTGTWTLAEGTWTPSETDSSATWVPKGKIYPYIHSYYVEWRRITQGALTEQVSAISNWEVLGETTNTQISIDDAPAGSLEFRVKTRRLF